MLLSGLEPMQNTKLHRETAPTKVSATLFNQLCSAAKYPYYLAFLAAPLIRHKTLRTGHMQMLIDKFITEFRSLR